MIYTLIWILVLILVFGVILWALRTLIPLPHPWGVVAQVIVGLIFLLLILNIILPYPMFYSRGLP